MFMSNCYSLRFVCNRQKHKILKRLGALTPQKFEQNISLSPYNIGPYTQLYIFKRLNICKACPVNTVLVKIFHFGSQLPYTPATIYIYICSCTYILIRKISVSYAQMFRTSLSLNQAADCMLLFLYSLFNSRNVKTFCRAKI